MRKVTRPRLMDPNSLPSDFRFHVAPFACDGDEIGKGEWDASNLSSEWLGRCRKLLAPDSAGRQCLPDPFGDFSVHATIAGTSGIASFFVRDALASSSAFLSGDNAALDQQVLAMFIESLRRIPIVIESSATIEPFAQMLDVRERPIHFAVPWPDGNVSDAEFDSVSLFSNHYVACILSQYRG